MVLIQKICVICAKPNQIHVPDEVVARINAGDFIQDAWPDSTSDEREVLISGSHQECWSNLFRDV